MKNFNVRLTKRTGDIEIYTEVTGIEYYNEHFAFDYNTDERVGDSVVYHEDELKEIVIKPNH